jgi:dynein heavy chain 2
MNNITNDKHVILLADIPAFQETLHTIMAQLERCQKALNDFLE